MNRFHERTNGKRPPGLLAGILTASPRRDIFLFGGVPDPARRAWTRPHGGYKTQEQVDRDMARCQQYLDEHEPPHTGPYGFVRRRPRRQRGQQGQRGQRDPSPGRVYPGPPAPGPAAARDHDEVSVGESAAGPEPESEPESDAELMAEEPQQHPGGRGPRVGRDAGSVHAGPRRPRGPGSDAGSVQVGAGRQGGLDGNRAGPRERAIPEAEEVEPFDENSTVDGGEGRRGPGSDMGSLHNLPRRPRGPASDAGSVQGGAGRQVPMGGNRAGPQGEARPEAVAEEVEPFDDNTTVDGGESHARPYYATTPSLFRAPRQRMAEIDETYETPEEREARRERQRAKYRRPKGAATHWECNIF